MSVVPARSDSIQQALKPLFFTLKLFGLYYDSTIKTDISDKKIQIPEAWKPDTQEAYPWRRIFQKIYCCLVLTLLSLSTLRYIPSFWVGLDYEPGLLLLRVIQLSWFLQCSLSHIIILRHCQQGTWEEYLKLWNESIDDTKCMCLKSVLKKLHVFSFICTVIGIFFLLFNVIGVSLMTIVGRGDILTTFVNPFTDSWTWIAIGIVCLIYYSATWTFTTCLILIGCKSIKDALCLYSVTLQMVLKGSAKNFPENFDLLRRRHLSLCRLVEILDRPTSFLLMVLLTTNIFLACFILYSLVNNMSDINTLSLVMFFMWLCTSFMATGIISYNVAIVHDAAHSPLDHIYEIETDNLTTQQLAQLTLFLSKLTGPSIGFTVMSLFTVTKEFILTIGGVYLTYFFLLLQFKI